jgi:hypothetical protein
MKSEPILKDCTVKARVIVVLPALLCVADTIIAGMGFFMLSFHDLFVFI